MQRAAECKGQPKSILVPPSPRPLLCSPLTLSLGPSSRAGGRPAHPPRCPPPPSLALMLPSPRPLLCSPSTLSLGPCSRTGGRPGHPSRCPPPPSLALMLPSPRPLLCSPLTLSLGPCSRAGGRPGHPSRCPPSIGLLRTEAQSDTRGRVRIKRSGGEEGGRKEGWRVREGGKMASRGLKLALTSYRWGKSAGWRGERGGGA